MKNISVLILDDNIPFTKCLEDVLLCEDGYTVELASNSQEAEEKFRQHDFDIAFFDIMLPGKNGVECFLDIKSFKPDAKVVFMTGFNNGEQIDKAMENGALGVLLKPFNMEDMFDIIKTHCS